MKKVRNLHKIPVKAKSALFQPKRKNNNIYNAIKHYVQKKDRGMRGKEEDGFSLTEIPSPA